MRPTFRLVALAALALAGCGDRLDHLGKPPTMSPPGQPVPAVAPLADTRAALARRAPPPPPERYASGSLWRSGPSSLFGDRRARTVGDILTVVIEIDESASMRNDTARSRSGSDNASVSALLGLPQIVERVFMPDGASLDPAVELAGQSRSVGSGSTRRSEDITLRVAATVTDVLPNGHLVIVGSQELRVNYELRDLQIAGVVRPEDITRRNEITYDKIADARVAYGGRGQLMDMQQPRYGQQVLDIVLPF
ncbi:MAG: flagellar basal body L-ring protein FlgH [Rhodobacteraceae bacterium]|nr:MAG: flagellar basal body L-ring protein FlgH [Paracoccaceae bacterium]